MKLTHPDKIYYEEDGISKQQLYDYYDEFHSFILPYIIQRPLTLVRCSTNYQECFYQKHPGEKGLQKGLFSIRIHEKQGSNDYIYIKDKEGLLALVQMGVLEIHPWESRITSLEKPDLLIFDLDPGPLVPWKKIVKTASLFRDELAALKLKSFVKTTGGKGLHIVVPIKPVYSWGKAKAFAMALCEYIALDNPADYTTTMKKSVRKGKIFLDYLRNQKGATAIAPYSTRARIHAPVATPVAWDELTNNFSDTHYTLATIGERLEKTRKDPWKNFFRLKQTLPIDRLGK